jgi:hypothetical protein
MKDFREFLSAEADLLRIHQKQIVKECMEDFDFREDINLASTYVAISYMMKVLEAYHDWVSDEV